MDIETSDGQIIKVEVVNFDNFGDQLTKKLAAAIVVTTATLLLERGADYLVKKMKERQALKIAEAKAIEQDAKRLAAMKKT